MDAMFKRTNDIAGDENIDCSLHLIKNNGFRVAFFCSSTRYVNDVVDKIREKIAEKSIESSIKRLSQAHYEFLFQNGSHILVRVPSDAVRGYRVHAIFTDAGIFDSVMEHCLIRPYLTKFEER